MQNAAVMAFSLIDVRLKSYLCTMFVRCVRDDVRCKGDCHTRTDDSCKQLHAALTMFINRSR